MPNCQRCGAINEYKQKFCEKCGYPLKETTLLNAWIWQKHSRDLQWRRVRLGIVPTQEMAQMYSVCLRWADAVVLSEGKVLIIEAKLRPSPGAIGQLEFYKKLFGVTPEFSAYWSWPIELVLLTGIMDLEILAACQEKMITFELFTDKDITDTFKR